MEDPFELIARSVDRRAVMAEIDQLDGEISRLAARKNKLMTLLSLLPGVPVTGEIHVEVQKPSLADAIPLVMAEGGRDAAWSADEILSALVAKQWAPGGKTPKNSVASTLSRLLDEGHLVRVGRGLYKIPSETSDGANAGTAEPATLLDDETGEDS